MLFASASFIFLFLPLSLAAFCLTPKQLRRQVLLIISAAFYILANLHSPLSIAIMALSVTATYFSGLLVAPPHAHERESDGTLPRDRRGSIVVLIATAFAIALLVAFRLLNVYGLLGKSGFPLGAAIWLLHCVSYLTDISRGDAQPGRPWDALLYLTFFPLTVVGPVVRYKVFLSCLEASESNVNTAAEGMRMFAVGFIERMAVAAVLVDAYEKIADSSKTSMGLLLGLFATILICLAAFFAFVGWSDMARGLSLMFGIRLPEDFGSALTATTPADYFSRIFCGLGEWYCDYIKDPVCAALGHPAVGRVAEAVGTGLGIVWLSVWLKCSPSLMLVGCAVGLLVALLELCGIDRAVKRRKWLAPAGWLATFFIAALFWTGGIATSVSSLFGMLKSITPHVTDYTLSYIMVELSDGRYIAALLIALLLVVLFRRFAQVSSVLPRGLRGVFDGFRTVVILGLFAFSLLFFMPHYPEYAVEAFKYFSF